MTMDKSASASPHLLIVEDNLDDVELLSVALTPYRHRLTLSWVPNVTTALQYLRKQDPYRHAQTPSVILVDLNLPVRSGRMLLQALGEDPVGGHSRVIVLSGSRTPADVEYALAHGADDFLLKPPHWDGWVELASQCATLLGTSDPQTAHSTRHPFGTPRAGPTRGPGEPLRTMEKIVRSGRNRRNFAHR